jgi:hypothetical protein
MLATLLTFAAELAEEEPNKTAFYVCGGIAAAWAIFLFAVGMRSEKFPATQRAQRGVMAVSVLVVLSAMASAILTG